MLVLNKPSGISVHGDGKNPEKSLADLVVEKYPEISGVGEPFIVGDKEINRSGIVHRLDKDTSGALIVAKNNTAFQFLKKQFQEHEIEKEYHAFTYGAIKNDEGVISEPIGRSGGDIRKWTTGRGARGMMRDAITEYRVIKRIGLKEGAAMGSTEEGTFTYVKLFPKTGRTHQIRVHLKHLNHPIVSDPIYAPNRDKALGFERLALHARAISFDLLSGERIKVEAPFPTDFQNAIQNTKSTTP